MVKKLIISFVIVAIICLVYPTKSKYSFPIMEGTKYETEVFINDSGKKGPTVFVIAGIHGNEVAGIYACDSLKRVIPARGTIVILPTANKVACDNKKRTMHYMDDLNRSFIGRENGTDTQRLAWDISNVIKKYNPKVVIDLHESSNSYTEGEYYLGNSIIFTPTDSSIELVMHLLENINKNVKKESKFTYFSGVPGGSINKEISSALNIPVITVETNMQLPVDLRKKQHTDIINLVLNYYGMDD